MPLLLVILTWESGFAIRYYSDFAPLMLLFILFIFFDKYEMFASKNDFSSVKVLSIIIGVTLLFAFVGQMAIIYDFVPNFGRHIGVEDYSDKTFYEEVTIDSILEPTETIFLVTMALNESIDGGNRLSFLPAAREYALRSSDGS